MLYLLIERLSGWLDERGLYGPFQLFEQEEFRALAAAFVAFVLVLALGRRTIRWLLRMKIGDAGLSDAAALASHSASKANTPTMGGVLIAGAMLVAVILLADLRVFYVQTGIIVLASFAGLGAADDWLKLTAARRGTGRQGLYAWEKLVFQVGLSALVAYFVFRQDAGGMNGVLNLPFQRSYQPGTATPNPALIILPAWAFITLGVLMITGMSNAVNITDGMDGLAGGISGFVAIGLLVLALIAGDGGWARTLLVPHIPGASEMAVLAGAMGGACFGFLWWNCSPAAVFMGDTGALGLGGIIGYIALVIRQEHVVLLISMVFLIEAASVAIQVGYFKATGGKRVFRCAPYHHHLHMGGWAEQQVVVRFWIVSVLLLVAGLASIKVR